MTEERWTRVKALFQAAMERPAAERDAFVAAAAGDDEALRRNVESLFSAEAVHVSFLDRPPVAAGAGFADSHGVEPESTDLTQSHPMLAPGHRIGSYDVVALLGAGAMGEVYRARDTRLNRDVALKVLPELFALDADRLARFKREAQMLAALNHPNVAAIHGLEESSGRQALVLELVDGPTVGDLIARGPIPVNEALTIARQIAEALEAAHEKGIIHRDLKPANIKIADSGVVKVLDFGLAKIWEGAPAAQLSESPTLTATHDRERMILGTPAYMSPEQARGQVLDKRTDIWAFGCVLYEMLSGARAFAADDVSGTLARVLIAEPDWDALPAGARPSIRHLLQRCLEKDPKRRLRDIGDVGFQIEEAQNAAPTGAATARVRKSRERVWWLAAMLIVVGMTTLYFRRAPTPQGVPAVARLTVVLPAGDRLGSLNNSALALSPGGTQLAYVGLRDGKQHLYLRSLDLLDSKAIPGTEGASSPFFSPDGQWIGFFALGKLKRVSAGGAVEILCDAPGRGGMGGSWGPDNSIYFAPNGLSGLWKVSASGGTPTEITRLDWSHGEVSHRWPQVLPGGKAVSFTVWTGPGFDEHRIDVQSLQTGDRRVLVRGGTTGRYVASGHLVYARADALMAVGMDLDRLEAAGDAPVLLTEQVRVGGEGAHYAVSDFGQLVYVPGNVRRYERQLVWVDRKGGAETVPLPARNYSQVALSPDGRQAAVLIDEGTAGIWIYDFPRATLTRLTSETSSSQFPVWTPDGRRIVYRGTRLGFRNLFWKPADAATEEERLTTAENVMQAPGSLSQDGRWLAFSAGGDPDAGGTDIWMLSLEDRKPQIFLKTPSDEYGPQFSPDGRWLAYVSNESGRDDIYVQPFPGVRRRWPISAEGGSQPRWARSGRELFYRSGDKMMAVDITGRPSFVTGSPRLLFEAPLLTYGNNLVSYDVAPDGQRFLGIRDINPDPPANQINVVLNWTEELKRLVPRR